MNTRLMMSVAAVALIAGTGFANAQGTGTSREAPAAERSAPSSAAPMNRDASDSAAPTAKSPSDEKMQPPGGQNQRVQQDMKAGPKGEKSAQDNMKQDHNMKGESSKSSENDKAKGSGKEMNAEGRSGNTNADSKSAADTKSQTTGQAGAGAKLSSDQRTRITTVIKGQHIQPVTNVNFSISVGTRVPRDVSFHPLPAEIVTIYPDWRGYEFILVSDQIVVVNPQTFEIVAVIDA
jgi:Protein of unknown function (DUF1236)